MIDGPTPAPSSSSAALVERRGNVALITINRPEARNAVNAAVSIAVGDALDAAQRDPEVRAVVITGAGQSFCAGADLKAISRRENLFHPERAEWGFAGYVQHYIDKPTIAAVNGTALGGGTELALASDLVVAEERTKFGLPEVKRGLIAAAGGVFRIVDHLPRKVAMELLFTGRRMDAHEARQWGIVNEIVTQPNLMIRAREVAAMLADGPPLVFAAIKEVVRETAHLPIQQAFDLVTRRKLKSVDVLYSSEDQKEGARAFAEKRKPVWKGR